MSSSQVPTAVAGMLVVLVLGSTWHVTAAASSELSLGFLREVYTTNAICSKKNCINPVFPAMEDLHRLEQSPWITSSLQKTSAHMSFCRNAISYDPALPVPQGGSAPVKDMVQRQDNAASTMFYYHLNGLGLEAWDYQKPEFASDCIKSVWRMVCYTYFPRAEVGVQDGAWSKYIRPCQSSCNNYVRACNVECCDESVECVFEHKKEVAGAVVITQGYAPHDGPSSMCTGAARRSTPLGVGFWILMIVLLAVSLQGCDYDVPTHNVGNWRAAPDYLLASEFIAPGSSASDATLNSCDLLRLSSTLQCSGRGVCKTWSHNPLDKNMLTFCQCDPEWADPECRTKRKSQIVAYMLSIFFGMFGADQFYLGFTEFGLMKLFTLGGCGIWWVADIIRIGSAPVYTQSFRVAADLPHWVYVLTCVMYACFLGFCLAYWATLIFRARKRKEAMLLQKDEEGAQIIAKPFADAYQTASTGKSNLGRPTHPVLGNPGYGGMAPGRTRAVWGSMGP